MLLARFAVRTRRFVAGGTGARVHAERRGTGLLLLASDLEERRARSVERWAGEIPIATHRVLDRSELGDVVGRDLCDVLYIWDEDLCRSLVKALGGS